jgi:chemotaxis response regulator CheB
VTGIRTVMVTTPAMLRDLIKRLAVGRVELDVVAEFNVRRALARRLTTIRPDLVVIGLRRNETDAVIRTLLARMPATKFIGFSSNGRTTLGYELRLYQTELGDASPDVLIDFIRSCASDLDV